MVVKPIDSDFTTVERITNPGPVIEDDDNYIFGTNIDVTTQKNESESKVLKTFDFALDSDDNDIDIVIDTGTDDPTAPTIQDSKLDGGPITEDHEPQAIEIIIDNDDKKDD